MKFMKKVTIIIALLLVSLAFVGAVSAVGYSDKTITPSTSLIPGQTVTAVFKIDLPAGSLRDTDTLSFSSPLVNAKWEIKIFKGKANTNSQNPAATISGTSTPNSAFKPSMFAIYYGSDTDVTLVVSFSGKVAETAGGTSINVITATCSNSQVGTWQSTAQKVYNPSGLNSDLTRVSNDIAATEKRIAEYAALGIDTASATQQVANAKTKLSAAQAAGSGNSMTAYANIEAADTFITQAERSLALAGIKVANTNIGAINGIANTLYERGWNSEAQYLETKVTSMKYTYDSLAAEYNNGGNPDTAKLDQLVKDSYTILEQANEYLENSKGLPIMQFLPIIIGVIVVIAAVVGIVFLIIKRRNNRWDELG